MTRYKRVSITAAASAEVTADILQSTESTKRKVLALAFDDTALVYGLAYVDQDQICEIELEQVALTDQWVPINYELQMGQTLAVGYYNGTGGSITKNVVVKYEEH